MKKDTVLVAICNQKGGVGKSTMTIMLAGYYHYLKGLNVAVIDCDYPQYSLVRMKERDMRTVEQSEYFKQLLKSQYERIQKKAYTIVGSKAENARAAAGKLMNNGNYDLIIVDLPGTVNSSGVINTIVNMDYVITPIVPDRIVMQSSLSFSTSVWDYAKTSKEAPLQEFLFFGTEKMPVLLRKSLMRIISSCKNWSLRYWIPSFRKPTAITRNCLWQPGTSFVVPCFRLLPSC